MSTSNRVMKVRAFIEALGTPPYRMVYPDLAHRLVQTIAPKYFSSILRMSDLEVYRSLDLMTASIEANEDHGMIERWRRTCHGIAEYLLLRRLVKPQDRVVAAECVIRLSGYYHHRAGFSARFHHHARMVGDLFWGRHGIELPYLKIPDLWTETVPSGDSDGHLSLWKFSGHQRALASRILCFLCQEDYDMVFIQKDAYNNLKSEYNNGSRSLLMRWSVSSKQVDRVAQALVVDKHHLTEFLTTQRFDQSRSYIPSAGPRAAWFRKWQHDILCA